MRIEVLYTPGGPKYQPTVEPIQRVLASESAPDGMHGVPVSTEAEAKALLFHGSPTVRINGEDVEPKQTNGPGLACCLYANRSGVPSEDLRRTAISQAKRKE